MLKISTKTRYALRSLLEMACRKEKKCFHLEELARHQNISRKYLENIFRALRKHGIVKSRKGRKGGFYLTSDLRGVTVLKIFEALEGKVEIVDCKHTGKMCERVTFCPTRAIWQELNNIIKNKLNSKNLKSLSKKKDIQRKCSHLLLRVKKTRKRYSTRPRN